MSWLQKEDMKTTIRTYRLDQILDEDDSVFEEAALTAESDVNNALFQNYNTATIFNTSGNDRDKSVLKWVKVLTLYYIYERVPDELVPERVIKNYDDTNKILAKIAEGDIGIELPRRLSETTGKPKTKFRWGSVPKRSH